MDTKTNEILTEHEVDRRILKGRKRNEFVPLTDTQARQLTTMNAKLRKGWDL